LREKGWNWGKVAQKEYSWGGEVTVDFYEQLKGNSSEEVISDHLH
jgi:hypothetical protein